MVINELLFTFCYRLLVVMVPVPGWRVWRLPDTAG